MLPYNDQASVERIVRQHRHELAGVIVEPVIGAGGVIPAERVFLEGLRALTRELGMLLIFDEVISLRIAPGGAQEYYGVRPDLTTMAKIIGGGLPVGAFGGRGDLMELLDPRRPDSIPHGGTYNGAPLGMAAGLATLKELTPDVYADLNRKGDLALVRVPAQSVNLQPQAYTILVSNYPLKFDGQPEMSRSGMTTPK